MTVDLRKQQYPVTHVNLRDAQAFASGALGWHARIEANVAGLGRIWFESRRSDLGACTAQVEALWYELDVSREESLETFLKKRRQVIPSLSLSDPPSFVMKIFVTDLFSEPSDWMKFQWEFLFDGCRVPAVISNSRKRSRDDGFQYSVIIAPGPSFDPEQWRPLGFAIPRGRINHWADEETLHHHFRVRYEDVRRLYEIGVSQ